MRVFIGLRGEIARKLLRPRRTCGERAGSLEGMHCRRLQLWPAQRFWRKDHAHIVTYSLRGGHICPGYGGSQGRTYGQYGKGRDRGPRRRGFDDDMFSEPGPRDEPPRQPFRRRSDSMRHRRARRQRQPSNGSNPTRASASLNWLTARATHSCTSPCCRRAGHEAVEPGTKLRVQVGQGQKGRQITAVLEVDASSAGAPQPARRAPPRAGGGVAVAVSAPIRRRPTDVEGTVKWFNGDKGFGFVVADDAARTCSCTSPSSSAPACARSPMASAWRCAWSRPRRAAKRFPSF